MVFAASQDTSRSQLKAGWAEGRWCPAKYKPSKGTDPLITAFWIITTALDNMDCHLSVIWRRDGLYQDIICIYPGVNRILTQERASILQSVVKFIRKVESENRTRLYIYPHLALVAGETFIGGYEEKDPEASPDSTPQRPKRKSPFTFAFIASDELRDKLLSDPTTIATRGPRQPEPTPAHNTARIDEGDTQNKHQDELQDREEPSTLRTITRSSFRLSVSTNRAIFSAASKRSRLGIFRSDGKNCNKLQALEEHDSKVTEANAISRRTGSRDRREMQHITFAKEGAICHDPALLKFEEMINAADLREEYRRRVAVSEPKVSEDDEDEDEFPETDADDSGHDLGFSVDDEISDMESSRSLNSKNSELQIRSEKLAEWSMVAKKVLDAELVSFDGEDDERLLRALDSVKLQASCGRNDDAEAVVPPCVLDDAAQNPMPDGGVAVRCYNNVENSLETEYAYPTTTINNAKAVPKDAALRKAVPAGSVGIDLTLDAGGAVDKAYVKMAHDGASVAEKLVSIDLALDVAEASGLDDSTDDPGDSDRAVAIFEDRVITAKDYLGSDLARSSTSNQAILSQSLRPATAVRHCIFSYGTPRKDNP
ncbi:hypothetical protein FZEAL_4147 [Fusarium zealandicum]|uniref:Uncharacterized protein n=1 Tax=Fusarium zealandicum TaxID=1053134 RepID=A0A8H4XM69_9HYPO|nr:hypothetical protein FZEAL_4147 [Fusarium zealandicum]